ncbi:hypothetical protein [Parabacteroides gordonii]|jgi:adenosine deaminase|uniref:hypothetical protein n=1 Tax=Parabacteroides gordonii TaxID=574930 RepID=UPI00241EFE7B|nr:hypothetical protein [Parabacteroides gordonii]
MITQSYLQYLLQDEESLRQYFNRSKPVTLDLVKRSLMLIERKNNVFIPDHYYRLGQDKSFEGIHLFNELFTIGMSRFADEYLEYNLHDLRVHTKAEKQNEWQLILPFIPPLLMQSIILWKYTFAERTSYLTYISQVLKRNIVYTAIPQPYILQVKQLVEEKHGLYDLHIHLNGTLETDIVWQDYLKYPDLAYKDFASALSNEKVKEQYLQHAPFLDVDNFRDLLYIARKLRHRLIGYIISHQPIWENKCYVKSEQDINSQRASCWNLPNVIQDINKQSICQPSPEEHPLAMLVSEDCNYMYLECLFYIQTLDYMYKHPNVYIVGNLFHYYLLILGQVNRMLVQQTYCNGFEEFQKYTLNNFRGFSESYYKRRFLQLSGNDLTNIRFLEGRFAPKNTLAKDHQQINKIKEGWDVLHKKRKNVNEGQYLEKSLQMQEKLSLEKIPFTNDRFRFMKGLFQKEDVSQLSLVAHFIKTPDNHPDPFIRFREKRRELMQKAVVLVNLLNSKSENSRLVRSIDAASSEFDTPPEVFSTCYRYLRKHGYTHFTYHAGEDFFHILSGLRAIFETIYYLQLKRTDRIGHAVACGVSVDVWLQNIGTEMLIRQGEYLDNLLFAYHMISQYGDPELKLLMPTIAQKVENLCTDIYGKFYPISLQIQAWLMRGENPEEVLEEYMKRISDQEYILRRAQINRQEWFQKGVFEQRRQYSKEDLFLHYHCLATSERYNRIIKIETEDIFDRNALTKMQLIILKYLHTNEIVIETLPTSNVIIGHHHGFETYHLYNWCKWRKEGHPIPPIVVGTDDAGIFATNIYNEYCNIYCQLVYTQQMNLNDAINFIKELDYNSELYKFT